MSVLSVAKARVLLPKIIIRASKNDTNFFTTTPPQYLHELYHYNSKLAILNQQYMSMFTATVPVDFVGKGLYNEEILINNKTRQP